jgi:methionyl-tRNA formyltransferase
MRIVFMGTPDFACPTLSALVEDGHEIAAVYTRAPTPSGRGLSDRMTAVHKLANQLGIRVLTPTSLKNPAAALNFSGHGADVAIVVAYGLLLPTPILAAPRHGCLNLHASLLPRWRGAAPIERAIMAGDTQTGVAVMRMEEGLDTGPIALVEPVAIAAEMCAGELHDQLSHRGAKLVRRALTALAHGELQFEPQATHGIVYARKIETPDCRIRWEDAAGAIHNQVRGLSPSPGAFFETALGRNRERIKVLKAQIVATQGTPGALVQHPLVVACGRDAIQILQLQRAGRKPMNSEEFLRGTPISTGAKLT